MNLMLGDCLERMKEIPDGSVDLTVTSPPYDNLRTHNKAVKCKVAKSVKHNTIIGWVVIVVERELEDF